jgi:hypothetical protein
VFLFVQVVLPFNGADLFVDRLTRFLERGFISTLGLGKRASDHAIVRVKNLVDERGLGIQQDRDQCGVTTFDLEILQMVNCGLGPFPSKSK